MTSSPSDAPPAIFALGNAPELDVARTRSERVRESTCGSSHATRSWAAPRLFQLLRRPPIHHNYPLVIDELEPKEVRVLKSGRASLTIRSHGNAHLWGVVELGLG